MLPIIVLGASGGVWTAQAASTKGNLTPSVSVFAAVPSGMFSGARPAGSSCSVDAVNGNAAQEAAVDHVGLANFAGWVGDRTTGKVPVTLWIVLHGAQDDFYVQAFTGGSRPDVAAALHKPAFARSGFGVNAYLAGIPVGDYHVTIYYRIDGSEMVCPTNVMVSVQ